MIRNSYIVLVVFTILMLIGNLWATCTNLSSPSNDETVEQGTIVSFSGTVGSDWTNHAVRIIVSQTNSACGHEPSSSTREFGTTICASGTNWHTYWNTWGAETGTYYWWAYCPATDACANPGTGCEGTTCRTITITCSAPSSYPSLSSPSSGDELEDDTPRLSWSDVSDATKYKVEVATSSTFGSSTIREKTTSSTSWSVSPSLEPGIYYWHVYAGNCIPIQWYSIPSGTQWFEIVEPAPPEPCDCPDLRDPDDGEYVCDPTPEFDWSSVSGCDRDEYQIQVATSSSFSSGSIEIDEDGFTSSDFTPTSPLTSDNTYYWRVRAHNDYGWTPWSECEYREFYLGEEGLDIETPTEALTVEDTFIITWSSCGAISNVRILYSINGGTNWDTIASNVPNSDGGNYEWIIPNTPSNNCVFRIEDNIDVTPFDISGTFVIGSDEGLIANTPTTPLFINGNYNITWSSWGTIDSVMIEFTHNMGASWETLATSTPNDGEFLWDSIPEVNSLSCKFRISDAIDGIPVSQTDYFRIVDFIVPIASVLRFWESDSCDFCTVLRWAPSIHNPESLGIWILEYPSLEFVDSSKLAGEFTQYAVCGLNPGQQYRVTIKAKDSLSGVWFEPTDVSYFDVPQAITFMNVDIEDGIAEVAEPDNLICEATTCTGGYSGVIEVDISIARDDGSEFFLVSKDLSVEIPAGTSDPVIITIPDINWSSTCPDLRSFWGSHYTATALGDYQLCVNVSGNSVYDIYGGAEFCTPLYDLEPTWRTAADAIWAALVVLIPHVCKATATYAGETDPSKILAFQKSGAKLIMLDDWISGDLRDAWRSAFVDGELSGFADLGTQLASKYIQMLAHWSGWEHASDFSDGFFAFSYIKTLIDGGCAIAFWIMDACGDILGPDECVEVFLQAFARSVPVIGTMVFSPLAPMVYTSEGYAGWTYTPGIGVNEVSTDSTILLIFNEPVQDSCDTFCSGSPIRFSTVTPADYANPIDSIILVGCGFGEATIYNFDDDHNCIEKWYIPEVAEGDTYKIIPGTEYDELYYKTEDYGYIPISPTAIIDSTYALGIKSAEVPRELTMKVVPNPFNSSLSISYSLPEPTDVQIDIFDLTGHSIATVVDEYQQTGMHTIKWEVTQDVPSNTYFVRMKTEEKEIKEKVILVK